MDTSITIQAAIALGTIGSLFFLLKARGQDMSAKTLQDALKPLNEALIRHDKDHERHYATGNMVLRIAQQLTEHEKRDDERFDEIRDLLRENRDDIKELLGRPIPPTKRDYPQ